MQIRSKTNLLSASRRWRITDGRFGMAVIKLAIRRGIIDRAPGGGWRFELGREYPARDDKVRTNISSCKIRQEDRNGKLGSNQVQVAQVVNGFNVPTYSGQDIDEKGLVKSPLSHDPHILTLLITPRMLHIDHSKLCTLS